MLIHTVSRAVRMMRCVRGGVESLVSLRGEAKNNKTPNFNPRARKRFSQFRCVANLSKDNSTQGFFFVSTRWRFGVKGGKKGGSEEQNFPPPPQPSLPPLG